MPELDSLTNQFFSRREAMRPTLRTWIRHAALLAAAFFTATVAGVLQPFGFIEIFPDADPQTWSEIFWFFAALPQHYVELVATTVIRVFTEPAVFSYGISFSTSLLFILTAHEMGHYIACRIYGVDATLPYFIPLPPLIGPAGTLGAFIKIVSPMPSRRAVFDIGVAGPIAGFIALLPILFVGLLTMKNAPPVPTGPAAGQFGLYFSDPLLTQIFAAVGGVDLAAGRMNPFSAAAWLGLLITSLNLFPSGQLDGGHAVYAVFGERVHYWSGRIAFVVMTALTFLGWYLYDSPAGLLFAVLLAVMMRIRHPRPIDTRPLGPGRKILALLTLLIFVLSFVPFPIKIIG